MRLAKWARLRQKEEAENLKNQTEKVQSMITIMENERAALKDEMEKIEHKNKFLEAEIERENRPLGFDFSKFTMTRHQLP